MIRTLLLTLLIVGCSSSSVEPTPADAAIDSAVADSSISADIARGPADLVLPVDLALPLDIARDLSKVPACLEVSPSPIQCPATPAGQKAPPVAVTLSNVCNRDLNVFQVNFGGPNPGDFTLTLPNKPPFAIPAAGQVDASVVFGPSAQSPRSATFTIVSDDPAGIFVGQLLGTGF